MDAPVRFWREDGPWGQFCNYYPAPITIDGALYATNEHYYQTSKFTDAEYKELIRTAATPNRAKVLASQEIVSKGYDWRLRLNPIIQRHLDRGVKMLPDWDDGHRDAVMLRGLTTKYTEHEELRTLLFSTGNRAIVEASPYDSYWGCGRDGKGMNRLGALLVSVRQLLRMRERHQRL